MTFRSLLFDFPAAAWFLVFLPLLAGVLYFLYRWRKDMLEAFGVKDVVERVCVGRSNVLYWTKAALVLIAFAAAVAALMGPKGNERYPGTDRKPIEEKIPTGKNTLRMKKHEVIFLIDASASMGIGDSEGGKTRLTTAREIADQVISGLRGESVSIYSFTSSAMRAVPATMDYFFARLMLRQIGINEGETSGTDIKAALETIRSRYLMGDPASTKTLIVLSDGGDTALYGLEGEPRKNEIDSIISPMAGAENFQLNVYAVGIGSTKGAAVPGITYQGKPVESSLDEMLLKKLALSGGGALFIPFQSSPFRTAQELSRIIARRGAFVDVTSKSPLPAAGNTEKIYDDYFQIPLAVALAALALFLLLPETLQKKGLQSPQARHLSEEGA